MQINRIMVPGHKSKKHFKSSGHITGKSQNAVLIVEKALEKIELITQEAEVGKVYTGIVRRITTFGAFVEILPGTDGLVHISELDVGRVERVEDIIKLGDTIEVKCLSIDQEGKVRLSRRALLPGGEVPNPPPDRNRRDNRNDRRPQRPRR